VNKLCTRVLPSGAFDVTFVYFSGILHSTVYSFFDHVLIGIYSCRIKRLCPWTTGCDELSWCTWSMACSGRTCYYFHADFLFFVTQWPYLDLKLCEEVDACQEREMPGTYNTCKVHGRRE
jgi:hypothetical protein